MNLPLRKTQRSYSTQAEGMCGCTHMRKATLEEPEPLACVCITL